MSDNSRTEDDLDEVRRLRLAALVELGLAAKGVTPKTALGYQKRARAFDKFCAAFGVASEPDPFLIAAFTLASFRLGHKPSGIGSNLTGTAWRYGDSELLRISRHTLARLRRDNALDPTSQAPACPRGALLAMARAAATARPGSAMPEMTCARDHCFLTVGVGGCLRPVELSLARIEHLERSEDAYYLSIVGSKTNKDHQRSEGVWLLRRDDDLDPVGALDRYLAILAAMGITEGPLFRGYSHMDDDRCGMVPTYISQRLGTIAGWAGLTPGVSGYSLRRSGATLAYLSGTVGDDLAKLLRHRSLDSTARYVDLILSEDDAAAWLSETIPDGWAPATRPRVASTVWADAGPLEDLIEDAAALAAEEVLAVGPRTSRINSLNIAQWRAAAERDGIDPERPLPEDFALYLASKVDAGLHPRALKSHIFALQWWFTLRGNPQLSVIRTALAVQRALLRSGKARPVQRRAPRVTVGQLAEAVEHLDVENEWRLHAAALARDLRVRLYVLDRVEAETAVFEGEEATIVVRGAVQRLWPTNDALTNPVDALRGLVERRDTGTLIMPEEHADLRQCLWDAPECIWEPSRMTGERWRSTVDLLARHVRARLRLETGICLGLAGLLGLDQTVAVHWEHLRRHSVGFVLKGSAKNPLGAGLEGRLLFSRRDSLDLEPSLVRLAEVWPWPGNGLFGCGGPVLTSMERRDWVGEEPRALSTSTWTNQVKDAGRRIGVRMSPLSIRDAGAHEDWFAHHDELRLQARMGHVFPSATRDFLKKHGLLGASATEPEVA